MQPFSLLLRSCLVLSLQTLDQSLQLSNLHLPFNLLFCSSYMPLHHARLFMLIFCRSISPYRALDLECYLPASPERQSPLPQARARHHFPYHYVSCWQHLFHAHTSLSYSL